MADIFGVRVTPTLDTLGTFIICNDAGGQVDPSVTFNGENFFVVWSDPYYDRTPGIVGALITPQGVIIDSNIHISDGNDYPDIAFDGDRSLVIWYEDFTGILGRFVNEFGQPQGASFIISRITGSSTVPKIEYGDSVYLVVYADFCSTGTDLDIYGQLVSPQGQIIGSEITIADGTTVQSFSDLSFDGVNFFVLWQEDNHSVWGRFVSTDGFVLDDEFQISQDTTYNKEYPATAVGSENYLIVWGEYHEDYDIYGNIDISLGVEEGSIREIDRIYPSIITGQLIIDDFKDIVVYDVMGQRVISDDIQPGVYFLMIDQKRVEKIIKLR